MDEDIYFDTLAYIGHEEEYGGGPEYGWVYIEGVKKQTQKAILVLYQDIEVWVPKSVIMETDKDRILVVLSIFSKNVSKVRQQNAADFEDERDDTFEYVNPNN